VAFFDDLASQVTRLRVESSYLPPLDLANPFQPGPPNPYLQRLRPKVTLEIAGGAVRPIVLAPYGDPGPSRWPAVRGALAFGAVALGALVVAAFVRKLRR
jgi:hypothetical protein